MKKGILFRHVSFCWWLLTIQSHISPNATAIKKGRNTRIRIKYPTVENLSDAHPSNHINHGLPTHAQTMAVLQQVKHLKNRAFFWIRIPRILLKWLLFRNINVGFMASQPTPPWCTPLEIAGLIKGLRKPLVSLKAENETFISGGGFVDGRGPRLTSHNGFRGCIHVVHLLTSPTARRWLLDESSGKIESPWKNGPHFCWWNGELAGFGSLDS